MKSAPSHADARGAAVLRALALAACVAAPAAARADVTVTSEAGLGGTCTSGSLAPVILEVASSEKDAVEVAVSIRKASGVGAMADLVHEVRLALGPGARKRITVPVVVSGWEASEGFRLSIRARTAEGEAPLLRHGTDFTESGRLDVVTTGAGGGLRVLEGGRTVVALLGDPGTRSRWLGERLDDALASGGGMPGAAKADRAVLVPVEATAVPDLASGWEGADALVWIAPDPSALGSPMGETAILEWVASGGRLVVAATPESRLPAAGALARALPAQVLGHDEVPAVAVLRALVGGRVASRYQGDLAAARLDAVRGEVLAAMPDGRPVAVRGPHGLGSIVLLAADPRHLDIATQAEGDAMARLVLGGVAPEMAEEAHEWFPLSLQSVLRRLRRDFLRPPPLWGLALGLALYLVAIGPLDWWLLKRRNALRRTVITFPATVAAFTALAWAASFLLFGGNSGRTRLAWIDCATAPSGDADTVRGVDLFGAYSPVGTTLSLRWEADRSTVGAPWLGNGLELYGDGAGGLSGGVVHGEDGTAVAGVTIPLRSFRAVQARFLHESPATLDASLRAESGRRVLRVRNHWPVTVRELHFVEGDRAYALGDLAAGGTVELPLPAAPPPAAPAGFPLLEGKAAHPFPPPHAPEGLFQQHASVRGIGAEDEAPGAAATAVLARAAMGATFAGLAAEGKGARGAARLLRRQGVDLSADVREGRQVLLGWCDADPTGILPADRAMDEQVIVVRRVLAPRKEVPR